MDLTKFTITFLIVVLCGCSYTASKFKREVWIKHPQVDDRYNPRAEMVQDLMKNYLKPGMSRKAVLDLLGNPYKEGIEQRLPENIVIPNSMSFSNPENSGLR
jgi:outer membrane protein assembly factor BamE (lipoprotein component of BamABCDE complex)